MLKKLNKRQRGFTLIELLIVVAIIGIIAALLIPNFIDALHKGRQKRTMGDIRQLGTGLAMFYTDSSGAAAAGQTTVDIAQWTGAATQAELETALVPQYIQEVVENDAWNNPLDRNILLNPTAQNYAMLRSPGRHTTYEGTTYTVGPFDPTDYDQDIVWADGTFVRRPGTVSN